MTQRKCVEAIVGTGLSVGQTNHGTTWLDPATDLYPYGSVVRILAEPDPGYYFLTLDQRPGRHRHARRFPGRDNQCGGNARVPGAP